LSSRLQGKVALITGTGGGQGRAAAILFAAEGATIVGCDLKVEGSEETLDLVRSTGGAMTSTHPLDLGDPEAARAWVDEAAELYGGFDILYNNASLPKFAPVAKMSDEDWHFTVRNELDLIFYTCRAAWPHLVRRGGGSIINIGSISGMSAVAGTPGSFAHAATKGAVIALTRELALEGGPDKIRVNTISPGAILSPATEPAFEDEVFRSTHLAANMVNRIGMPEDVAYCALYLASDESTFVTGANFVVDGGFMAK
jgi:meso-butanediol dehydrogenase/(S,S)-butanediol dehydrogenase/diacetyl reductase